MTRAAPGAKLVDKKTNEPRKGVVVVLMRAVEALVELCVREGAEECS